jgi:uncharacterized protein (DUF3084 family)
LPQGAALSVQRLQEVVLQVEVPRAEVLPASRQEVEASHQEVEASHQEVEASHQEVEASHQEAEAYREVAYRQGEGHRVEGAYPGLRRGASCRV